jgi:serine/threonine protein kinase
MLVYRYEMGQKIGEGAFGAVFQGRNKRTSEPVAIKLQSRADITNMKYEAKIYQYLNSMKCDFVPQIKWFGIVEDSHYLVMELLGERIGKTNKSNAMDVGLQLIDALCHLHKYSLIHRDVKPANILYGCGHKCNKIYLIDFGLAKRYECHGKHMDFKYIHGLIGSPNYVSLNVHRLNEPSRRDDLVSAIYVIMGMYMDLPWLNVDNKKEMKEQIEMELLSYIYNLQFEDDPDYEKVKRLLLKV